MFHLSLRVHSTGESHLRAAVMGVKHKVHGVLITPCGPQLNSSQDKVDPCKCMHNGIQLENRPAAVALELHVAVVTGVFHASEEYIFLQGCVFPPEVLHLPA